MELLETIWILSEIPGVSGGEQAVADWILHAIQPHCDAQIDALGNVIAFKKGKNIPKNKLMLSAHMDEVGLIVTYVEDEGLLRFATVGGIDRRVIVGKTVLVGKEKRCGVIGTKAVHLQSAEGKDLSPELDALYIDIGAKDREEALRYVALGDYAVFDSDFLTFGNGLIKGRALDDRAGCALLIDLIQSELEYDATFAFTVQEETGTTGAVAAAHRIAPDIGIAVETTTACDIPGVAKDKQVCALGKGGVVSFMDRGTIYDRTLYQLALDTATEHGIPVQTKAGVYGGNESRSVQVAGNGAKVLAVSLPCRYLHTPSCVLSEADLRHTADLLRELLSRVAMV